MTCRIILLWQVFSNFQWHIYHWAIYVFSNCLLEKVCCGALIFAARRPWNWTVGPKVILNLRRNIFLPFSVMGGIFGTMERCCVLREVPLPLGLRPQTPFLWRAGAAQTSVAYLCYVAAAAPHTNATGHGPHPQLSMDPTWGFREALGSLNMHKWWAYETSYGFHNTSIITFSHKWK